MPAPPRKRANEATQNDSYPRRSTCAIIDQLYDCLPEVGMHAVDASRASPASTPAYSGWSVAAVCCATRKSVGLSWSHDRYFTFTWWIRTSFSALVSRCSLFDVTTVEPRGYPPDEHLCDPSCLQRKALHAKSFTYQCAETRLPKAILLALSTIPSQSLGPSHLLNAV